MSSKYKQTTIFHAFQNWKSLEKKKQREDKYQMKIFNVPGLIDLTQLDTDSDSDTEIQRADTDIIVKSEPVQVSGSTIGVHKPNASSTPLKSHNFPESDCESSDGTVILEDSINLKTTSPASISESVSIKQNILITPVEGKKNNKHVPESTKSVVGGPVEESKKISKNGNINKPTSVVSSYNESRKAKLVLPRKDDPENKNSENALGDSTRKKVILKQNILIKPVESEINKHVPESSKTVVGGPVGENKKISKKGNLNKPTSVVSSCNERREAHKLLLPSKGHPEKINSENTFGASTEKKVILKQNILIKPVESKRNNSHVPELTKTVVGGQVDLNRPTSSISSCEDSRGAHKASSPNKELPGKIPSEGTSKPHNQNLKMTNLSENTSKTSSASEKNLKLQNRNKQDQETESIQKPSPSTSTGSTKRKSDITLGKEKQEKNLKQSKTISNYLTAINNLFETIYASLYLKTLIEEEKPVLNLMAKADPKYFFVCLKLCTWLPKWYNIFEFCGKIMVGLEEKEIIDLYEFLKCNKMVDIDIYKEDLPTLLKNLSKGNLMSICKKFKILKAEMKKDELIQLLLKYCKTQTTLLKKSVKDLLLEEVNRKMGYCIKVNASFRQAFYKAYILGTFTNPAFSDINDFFNIMLNHQIAFPDYAVEDYVVFYSKEEFTSYVDARKVRDSIEDIIKSKNHLEMLQVARTALQGLKNLKRNDDDQDRYKAVPHLRKFTAESVYISCLSTLAEPLKAKFPSEVRTWLEYLINNFPTSHRLGDWYDQLTWLYIRYLKPGDYEHTAKLIIEILKSDNGNVSDVQRYQIRKRAEQLKKGKQREVIQLDHDIITELLPVPIKLEDFPSTIIDATAIRSNDQGRKRKYVVQESDGTKTYMTVENIALEYYTERCGYTTGDHCEGSLVAAIFALLFWDIIYRPEKVVPGAFLSKLQTVPLDMHSTHFYRNRKDAIDERLELLERGWSEEELMGFLRRSWEAHSHESGYCEPGLKIKEPALLETLVRCVGRGVLAKIFARLVRDVRLYRSGMPDLLVWDVDNCKSKFVEVKGENDKLSIKQQLWLKYLMSIGANIEVCNVHSMGSKRMKRKNSGVDEKKAKLEKKQVDKKAKSNADETTSKAGKEKRKSGEITDAVGEKKAKIDKGKRKPDKEPADKSSGAFRNKDDSGIFNEDSDASD